MKKHCILLFFSLVTVLAFGQSRHPYYGGGYHRTSHGGNYLGGSGSSHRGGHYINWRTSNTYGRHRKN